jgi:hypothetical protein
MESNPQATDHSTNALDLLCELMELEIRVIKMRQRNNFLREQIGRLTAALSAIDRPSLILCGSVLAGKVAMMAA